MGWICCQRALQVLSPVEGQSRVACQGLRQNLLPCSLVVNEQTMAWMKVSPETVRFVQPMRVSHTLAQYPVYSHPPSLQFPVYFLRSLAWCLDGMVKVLSQETATRTRVLLLAMLTPAYNRLPHIHKHTESSDRVRVCTSS
jgi:hypothetical protein